jgi:MFS family permease
VGAYSDRLEQLSIRKPPYLKLGLHKRKDSKADDLCAATALCRLCEPIAFMSVFPYIYFMIGSFEIAADDGQIAIYAGMVTTAFAFSEFLTGVLWGNLSDRVGRKPCLIGGLLGTAISMIIFGFSRNFTLALIARALGGLLNGYVERHTTQTASKRPKKPR